MANEDKLIVGVWKLVSVMYEDQDTKAMTPIMGDHPRGYQIATPDGRWLALATPSGRTAPSTDAERAQAFRSREDQEGGGNAFCETICGIARYGAEPSGDRDLGRGQCWRFAGCICRSSAAGDAAAPHRQRTCAASGPCVQRRGQACIGDK